MALAFADRVRETTTTTGTGTITLAGAVTGYQSFSAIGNANTTYYTINAGSQWEVGIGTYTASGTTLSRDTVLSSSNAGSLVDFSAGTKDVFVGYPAGKVVIQDASGNVGIGTASPTAYSGYTSLEIDNASNGGILSIKKAGSVVGYLNGASGLLLLAQSNDLKLTTTGSTSMQFSTNSTERMRLDASGNFGVGRVSPDARLSVDSGSLDVVATFNSTGNTYIQLQRSGAGHVYLQATAGAAYLWNQQSTPFLFGTSNTERMRIGTDGEVAIATSSAIYTAANRGNLTIGGSASSLLFLGTGGTTGTYLAHFQSSNSVELWNGANGHMAFATNNTERMRIDSSGSVTANVDIRAPIFYDSANTAYYLDPTGSTSLNVAGNMLAAGNVELGNGANRRVRIGSATNYNYDLQTTGDDFQIIEAGTTPRLTIKYPNGNVGIGTSSPSARLAAQVNSGNYLLDLVNGSETGFALRTYNHGSASAPGLVFTQGLYYTTTENASIKFYRGGGATGGYLGFTTGSGTEQLSINSSGNVTATVDVRAPIFYDSSNTAYYLDPASTSNLNALTLAGTINNAGVYGRSAAGIGYLSGGYNGVETNSTTGPIYCISTGYAPTSTTLASMYGIGYTDGGSAGVWSGGGWGMYAAAGGVARVFLDASNGIIHSTASVRSPVFYDSNDTNYFLDPNSTSVLSTVRASTIQFSSGNTAIVLNNASYQILYDPTARPAIYLGGADPGNYYDNTGHYFRDRSGTQYGSITASGMFANVFYDYGNTAYYVDPASTTTSIQVAGAVEQGNNYAHPQIEWSSSSATGMVIFYLPGTTSNYGMVHMVFDIYEYVTGKTATVIIGGHNWSTSWYNVGVQVVGWTDKTVRLGVKNGRFCVIFGGVGSSWTYGTIRLRKIHNASFYDNIMDLGGNWSTELTNTESFTTVTSDLRQLRTSNTFTADGDVRSPIFYDSNDTGYYLDPSSSSQVNVIYGYNWYSRSDANYGFIGNNVYVDTVNSGYASDPLELCYVRGTGVNIGTGGGNLPIRADIFYEGTNTTYYLDPASTGTSLNVAGSIVAAGNVTAYSDIRVKDNVETVPAALAKLSAIRGVTYTRTDLDDKERRYAGVIAQEIEQVLPEAIFGDEHTKTVDYNATIALLIQAVKELSAKVEALEAKEY